MFNNTTIQDIEKCKVLHKHVKLSIIMSKNVPIRKCAKSFVFNHQFGESQMYNILH